MMQLLMMHWLRLLQRLVSETPMLLSSVYWRPDGSNLAIDISTFDELHTSAAEMGLQLVVMGDVNRNKNKINNKLDIKLFSKPHGTPG